MVMLCSLHCIICAPVPCEEYVLGWYSSVEEAAGASGRLAGWMAAPNTAALCNMSHWVLLGCAGVDMGFPRRGPAAAPSAVDLSHAFCAHGACQRGGLP